ncbi:MAG: hypothetical protein O3A51_06410 [Verrucomicrobia bacterium]|nr:hypothetical protein [Verrucomicrobiota bacterium]
MKAIFLLPALALPLFLTSCTYLKYAAARADDGTPRHTTNFVAELSHPQDYARAFGGRFVFGLKPTPYGWQIDIRDERGTEDIAALTPPWRWGPNPRDIAGWHFRNADNSGPNDVGPNNVNAPQDLRSFIFHPLVGRCIDGSDPEGSPSPAAVQQIEAFGRGALRLIDYRLTEMQPGKKARLEWIKFNVELSWACDAVEASRQKD